MSKVLWVTGAVRAGSERAGKRLGNSWSQISMRQKQPTVWGERKDTWKLNSSLELYWLLSEEGTGRLWSGECLRRPKRLHWELALSEVRNFSLCVQEWKVLEQASVWIHLSAGSQNRSAGWRLQQGKDRGTSTYSRVRCIKCSCSASLRSNLDLCSWLRHSEEGPVVPYVHTRC